MSGSDDSPANHTRLAAVILAAGASTRMGSAKALLTAPGTRESFLDRLIGVFAAHCAPVIVVLGHDADRIRAGLQRKSQALFVVNQDYSRGQLSSLQVGLRAVPPESEGILFTPLDLPLIRENTVARLKTEFFTRPREAVLVIPRFEGRRGHPVCCARQLLPEFLEFSADTPASDVIHRHVARTCYVDVDDPGILRDVDDPESYRNLCQEIAEKAGRSPQ